VGAANRPTMAKPARVTKQPVKAVVRLLGVSGGWRAEREDPGTWETRRRAGDRAVADNVASEDLTAAAADAGVGGVPRSNAAG
jgi:hypothetical protein